VVQGACHGVIQAEDEVEVKVSVNLKHKSAEMFEGSETITYIVLGRSEQTAKFVELGRIVLV
jgi:hypothetical protein